MRNVVLHYHIFKNAGRTVDALLQRTFGGAGWTRLDEAPPRRTYPASELLARVRAMPDLRAVSSHQARLPLPEAADIAFHPLLFLRHPIDRVGSVYAFERRQRPNAEGIGIAIAQREDLAGYVRWRLTHGNGSVIRNFQTVHLSACADDMRTAIATDADLAVAIERLRALPCFGLVERFAASAARLVEFLRPFGDAIGLETIESIEAVDPSVGRASTLAQRLVEIEQQLGPSLYAELLDNNQLDFALYAEAERLFDQLPSG